MTDLRQLRHFVALAETLNYRLAAERLHMAQPPLSASIRKLEEHLGVALFERSRRGTSLTPAGVEALDIARRALLDTRQFEAVVRDVAAGLAGTLTVGYVSSAAYYVLPKLIPAFRERFPKIQLTLLELNSDETLDLIEQRSLDVGIVRTPLSRPTKLAMKAIQKDRFVAALPDVSPWREMKTVKVSDLAEQPFIFYTTPYARALTMLICESQGFVPQVQQEANGMQTVVSLVQCGLGVALVPGVARQRPAPGVLFRDLSGVPDGMEMGLATVCQRDTGSQLVNRFHDVVESISFDGT